MSEEDDCTCCPEVINTCTDSCVGGLGEQPSIKITDMGCDAICKYGYRWTNAEYPGGLEDGTLTESIPYYGGGYADFPGEEFDDPTGQYSIPTDYGCYLMLWLINDSDRKEQLCADDGVAPLGVISVTVGCCPIRQEYGVAFLWRHNPGLYNYSYYDGPNSLGWGFSEFQKICVVDGILRGSMIINLRRDDAGSYTQLNLRPYCQMCLTFGGS